MSENYLSVMTLIKVVFDELSFLRHGYKNDNQATMNLNVLIGENEVQNLNKVSITLSIIKEAEYDLTVKISGFFEINETGNLKKEELLKKNAVAILMPFIRSQVSILTAQPETESLILPVFNISKLMEDNDSIV